MVEGSSFGDSDSPIVHRIKGSYRVSSRDHLVLFRQKSTLGIWLVLEVWVLEKSLTLSYSRRELRNRMSQISIFNKLAMATVLLSLSGACVTVPQDSSDAEDFTASQFAAADTDKDSKLSRKEVATYLHNEALAEFDMNNDGFIGSAEWALTNLAPGKEDEHFNRIDKNSDGKIEKSEAVLFVTEHVSFKDIFKKLDQSRDDQLHWEEITAAEPGSLNVTLFSIRE